MKISAAGIAFIRQWEGCKLQAYKDGGGVWTIGVGHTAAVHEGQSITQFEADELLAMDLEDHDIWLAADRADDASQFDALSSLAFNIGRKAFAGSTVLKRHNLGNYSSAADAFTMWRFDNGSPSRGLLRRREAEAALYRGQA
jgi:lysozyme